MVWKLSMRCSALSMWAGRWQFRKHSMCPKAASRTLTPPLLPWGDRLGGPWAGLRQGGESWAGFGVGVVSGCGFRLGEGWVLGKGVER